MVKLVGPGRRTGFAVLLYHERRPAPTGGAFLFLCGLRGLCGCYLMSY
jgi:hypothetical protein